MFERIKCYRTLRKAEKFIRGARLIGQYTNNEELIRMADETLHKQKLIKERAWRDRKLARKYNQGVKAFGYYHA